MLKYSPVSNKTLKSALHTGGGGAGRGGELAVECCRSRVDERPSAASSLRLGLLGTFLSVTFGVLLFVFVFVLQEQVNQR